MGVARIRLLSVLTVFQGEKHGQNHFLRLFYTFITIYDLRFTIYFMLWEPSLVFLMSPTTALIFPLTEAFVF